jgi:hypothetical protein
MLDGEFVCRGIYDLRGHVLVDVEASIVYCLSSFSWGILFSDIIIGVMLQAGLWNAILMTGLVLCQRLWASCFVSVAIRR